MRIDPAAAAAFIGSGQRTGSGSHRSGGQGTNQFDASGLAKADRPTQTPPQQQAINYLKKIGVTDEDIKSIRNIMLEK